MKSGQVLLGASGVILAFAIAQTASAGEWYGVARVGQTTDASVSSISFTDDTTFGAGVGTSVGPVRVEAAVDRLSGEFGGGIVQASALDYSISANLDLPIGNKASVFGGVGLDYVSGEAQTPFGFSTNASGQGYSYSAGFAYRFSPGLIGEVRYKHLEADLDTDFGGVDLQADSVTAGLRFAL